MKGDSAADYQRDQTAYPKEQLDVIRFADQLDAERPLSGEELSKLAARMTKTDGAVEAATIREAIVRGFYGE